MQAGRRFEALDERPLPEAQTTSNERYLSGVAMLSLIACLKIKGQFAHARSCSWWPSNDGMDTRVRGEPHHLTYFCALIRAQASSLTRLRHPCVLEMQEPLEETRNELVFATEPVLAPLSEALIASESAGRAADGVQLDEVEIQKGLLQVSRGLEFLHSARMVHGNLTPDSILINAKGDWKLGGFAFLTPLTRADGTPTPWQLDYDPSLPHQLSRDFNYLAPEYALDEKLEPANDMYALGCVVYAIHSKGRPPFSNRNSIAGLRSNVEQLSTIANTPAWQRLSRDQLDLLAQLVTRYPGARLTAASFQNSEYFNNVLVRTLKFMERDNFAGRNKEERVQFLKGLLGIMEQFSQRLQRRKVLPAVSCHSLQ